MGSEWFRARSVEAKVLHSLSRGIPSWYHSLPFPDARKLFGGTLTISWLAGKEVLKWGGMRLGVGGGAHTGTAGIYCPALWSCLVSSSSSWFGFSDWALF